MARLYDLNIRKNPFKRPFVARHYVIMRMRIIIFKIHISYMALLHFSIRKQVKVQNEHNVIVVAYKSPIDDTIA